MVRVLGRAKSKHWNTDVLYWAPLYLCIYLNELIRIITWCRMISFGSHGWLHAIQFAQNNSVKVTLGGSDCSNWIEGNLRHNVGTGWSVTHVQTSESVEDKTDKSFVKLWKGHINTVCSKATREKKITLQPQYPIFFKENLWQYFFLLVANKFDQIGRAHQIGLCFLNYLINLRGVATTFLTWGIMINAF